MNITFHGEVAIPAGGVNLEGELVVPTGPGCIVIFSHGSGSSRHSRRNQEVASYLQKRNIGTLLFDLLTEEEDRRYSNRFDIGLLTSRLILVTKWLQGFPAAERCSIGYFGASTGAASALKAAATLSSVKAVVSRGGRPDLVKDALNKVTAPTLLIVGSLDSDVLELNREAFMELRCEKNLEIIEGATHLFEETGKMEMVSELAASWFEKYLKPSGTYFIS